MVSHHCTKFEDQKHSDSEDIMFLLFEELKILYALA